MMTSNRASQSYLLLSVLGILLGIFVSWQMRWLGDDIFIALRYVKNFTEGHGLVYNTGERVEGYTDFLWLMLVSFFSWLHFDAPAVTEVLGIIFSSGTLIIFAVIGHRVKASPGLTFPFIVLALVLNYDYNVWATSGLEVSFVSFLLSLAFYIFFFSRLSDSKKFAGSGFFICLALLTRPDVMLILVFSNVLLFSGSILQKQTLISIFRKHLLFNLPVLLIYFPYFLWRYNYYGFIFPNTYYDKLGYETAFAQGFFYIWLYFKCHYSSFLVLLALVPVYLAAAKTGIRNTITAKAFAPLITAFSIMLIYLVFFVAKVGGDFMFARFILPCVPFIYFLIFYSLHLLQVKKLNLVLALLLLLSASEFFMRRACFIQADEAGKETPLFPHGIADERYCYLYFTDTKKDVQRGKELHELLGDINYKAIIFGGQARFAYYAGFSYCQEYFGLTDTLIAHSEIKERGRIGHEKHGSMEYFEGKKINFSFLAGAMKEDKYRFGEIDLPSGPVNFEIISYDNDLMSQIEKKLGKKISYIHFPEYLGNYISTDLPSRSYAQLKEDYENFYAYYFKNNDDKEHEKVFLDRLAGLKPLQ
jgi:hypothetical protein